MASAIITSIVTGGTNNHATVSSEANGYATDFISQGCLGSLANTNGVAPATGSYGVNQNTGSDMNLLIKGTGNTTNTQSVAYITATPATQDKQVLRARMSADYTPYAINSNSTGSTVYDYIYLQANATNANTPDAAADNVVALYTSRSTSNSSDNGAPPTYGILLAVVTVANGATAITNANIADKRTQVIFNTGGATSTTGWSSLGFAFTYASNAGNKEFTITTPNNLTGLLSPGMKMQFTRSVTPPTQCAAFASASSQYAAIASPSGISFTSAFTLEGWVYLLSYGGAFQTIVRRDNGTSHGDFSLDVDTTGQLRLFYEDSSGNNTAWETYTALPLNQWIHVAGAVSSVSSKTLGGLYFNGLAQSVAQTASAASALNNAGRLAVGGDFPTGGAASGFFNGYISEVRIWSVAQTAANIQANMTINLIGTETNLVGLWQFNGAWTDATTNANTLVASGGASNTQVANPYNAIEYGVINTISYANPTTTLTLDCGPNGTIPNQTLSSPGYSIAELPFGLPANLGENRIIYSTLITSNATYSTSDSIVNGSATTLSIPVGRIVEVEGYCAAATGSAADAFFFSIYNTATVTGTAISVSSIYMPTLGTGNQSVVRYRGVFTAGSQSFCLAARTNTGTLTLDGSTSAPLTLIVRLIG